MAEQPMPPADAMPMPEDAGMAPSESMTPPAPTQEGSVMVSMPKVAFDAIRELIVQLASGLDSLAQGVDQQAAAEAEAAVGGEMMPPEGAMPTEDEEFLAGITQEGSQR